MDLQQINTERLILRKLSPSDLNYLFENKSKEEIKKILGYTSEEDFFIEKTKYEKGYTTHDRSFEYFQMIPKDSDQIIGACGFHNWYLTHKRAEIGYAITDKNFEGKGLMTETLGAVIDHGFNKMELNRIESMVGPENTASQRLMEKFGFNKEGVLRQHHFRNNKFEDSILFSKLRHEHNKPA